MAAPICSGLRIPSERSTAEAIDAIHDGLSWLGLAGDEPAVSQSARADRHAEVALALVEADAAYRCYLSDEELATLRDLLSPMCLSK